MADPPKRDSSKWTTPRQFRLSDETLADLDAVAAHYTAVTGMPHTRTDVIRRLAREKAAGLRPQPAKPSAPPPDAGPRRKKGR